MCYFFILMISPVTDSQRPSLYRCFGGTVLCHVDDGLGLTGKYLLHTKDCTLVKCMPEACQHLLSY
jgi:hypothetical protein